MSRWRGNGPGVVQILRSSIAMLLVAFAATLVGTAANAAGNYPDRKAHVVNICPHVEINSFSFANQDRDRRTRFVTDYKWTNKATQPIVAIEIVTLKYDAFDQRLIGSRFTVTGKNSADWTPLSPGESQSDGSIGFGSEEVFTAISYVRRVRLADGTVWTADDARLLAELKKVAPGIRNPGSLAPDPKAPAKD